MLSRRGFLGVLAGAIAAPAVIRSGILMPVRAIELPEHTGGFWLREEILVLPPSMFQDLMEMQTEIIGINRAELGWWQGITIKQELIPNGHEAGSILEHQIDRIPRALKALERRIPQLRDLSLRRRATGNA